MKCKGEWEIAGAGCETCSLFMDNCEGHPDWADYNGQWLPIDAELDGKAMSLGQAEGLKEVGAYIGTGEIHV